MRKLITATIAAGLIGSATGAAAQAQDWRRLGQDGPFEVGVDVGSYGGSRTARTARTVMVALEEPAKAYMVLNIRIDCEARTISAVDMALYDAEDAVIRESALPPDTTPVSETDGTGLLARALCDGKDIPGRGFGSAADFADWAVTQPVES